MSRPSRSRAAASTSTPAGPGPAGPSTDAEADPEFMALTPRQRRSIDRAFDRATRPKPKSTGAPSRKRRKLDSIPPDEYGGGGGGFMDVDIEDGEGEGGFMDAGGFIPDDDGGGGGFLPSDQDDDGGSGGGFMPDSPTRNAQPQPEIETETETETKREDRRLPIRLLPAILSSLNLPSDEDVLSVFRSSASGWDDPSQPAQFPRRRRGEDEDEVVDLSVGLKDFRAVCAALMGPDEGDEGADGSDGEGEGEGEDDSDPESVYEEEGDGDGSSLSDLSGEDEYQDPTTTSTSKGKGKAKTKATTSGGGKGRGRGKKSRIDLEEKGKVKLNSRQKEIVNDLWTMIKPPPPTTEGQPQQQKSWGILGRDELRKRVRELGEMWTEDEITDMVTLFSTQHQGRGLSYDDFGAIMVRAGLA